MRVADQLALYRLQVGAEAAARQLRLRRRSCYRCGDTDHKARDCPWPRGSRTSPVWRDG